MSAAAAERTRSDSPFQRLDYYTKNDAARFAGREDEINAVVTGVLSFDTFVLYGRSGLGKTSLILAGIFPELEKRGFKPVYSRVLDLSIAEFRQRLETAIGDDSKHVVLVLDQFEEFFIRIREEDAAKAERRDAACREFASMLADLVERARGRLRILFGIREDFYAELEDFRFVFPEIDKHGFRLLPLTAYGARRAIVLPLEYANPPIRYDQKLLNLLVDEVARSGFDPLLLQIICTEVWRQANESRPGTSELTVTDFERVGGVDAIFRRYVARAAAGPENQQLVVRVILDTLITAEQTKRVVRENDLVHGGATGRLYIRARDEEVRDVLHQLVEGRLLRRLGEGRETRYELLHDRLVPEVKRWLGSDKDFVDFRFAKTFVANVASVKFREGSGYLLSQEQMAQMIDRWTDRLQLTADETELLFRSSIHKGTTSARFWGSRLNEFDKQRAAAVIGEMLLSKTDSVRASAARSVEVVPSPQDFVPQLLRMALEDPIQSVRGAAARSFASHASDDDLNLLSDKSKDALLRDRATEVVVECYDQLRSPSLFPWMVRRRAWVAVRRRSARADGERIRKAMATGAITGTIIGALWALTVGYGVAMMVRWNTNPEGVLSRSVGDRVLIATYLGLLGAAAGAAMGCVAARREARRTAVSRWELFYGGRTRGVTQGVISTGIASLAWSALHIRTSESVFLLSYAIILAAPGVAMLALALLYPGTKEGTDRWGTVWLRIHRVWPWVGLSIIAAVCALAHGTLRSMRVNPIHVMGFVFVGILSAPIASAVLSLRLRCKSGDRVSDAFWTLLCTSGTGMLGTLFIIALVERWPQYAEPASIVGMALLLGCGRAAILGPATDLLTDEPSFFGWVQSGARGLATACLLLALAGYVYLFGLRSIAWLSEDSSTQIAGSLLHTVPNVHYHNLIGITEARPVFEVMEDVGFDVHMPPDRFDQETFPRLIEDTTVYFASEPFSVAVSRTTSGKPRYQIPVFTYPFAETVTKTGVGIASAELDHTDTGWKVRQWRMPPAWARDEASGVRIVFGPAVIWDSTKSTYWYYNNRDSRPVMIRGRVVILSDVPSLEPPLEVIRSFDTTKVRNLKIIAAVERIAVP